MNYSTLNRKAGFESKGIRYIFGKGGYLSMDELDEVVYAHILIDSYKLRTPDFSDKQSEQTLKVSKAGFDGMYAHLDIPPNQTLQIRSYSYKHLRNQLSKYVKLQENKNVVPKD